MALLGIAGSHGRRTSVGGAGDQQQLSTGDAPVQGTVETNPLSSCLMPTWPVERLWGGEQANAWLGSYQIPICNVLRNK